MKSPFDLGKCQLGDLSNMFKKPGAAGIIWQRIRKVPHSFRKRKNYLITLFSDFTGKNKSQLRKPPIHTTDEPLQPGDWVHVRSKKEIKATLDRWNRMKGCGFMEEMWAYCGTKQRVFKRVERFLDERDYLAKKCKGIVILEGVMCRGTEGFGRCDRSCFFFWREEWLKKV
jgi:hypothetical protein